MRVVAGHYRGRKLVAPAGDTTRPTTDKVREAVFNALGSADVLDGAMVADLYAGTGALGIEALSRGAAHVTFVETDRAALRALRHNLGALDLDDRTRIVSSHVDRIVDRLDVDLVFADPPYDFDAWPELLATLSPSSGRRLSLVVAESAGEIGPVDGWEITRSKRYGRTWVTFLQPARQ